MKEKYVIDKTRIDKEFVEAQFQFFVDSGYEYRYYEKYAERDFVYELKDHKVEIYLENYKIDCFLTIKSERINLLDSQLADDEFKELFLTTTNIKRIEMIVSLLKRM